MTAPGLCPVADRGPIRVGVRGADRSWSTSWAPACRCDGAVLTRNRDWLGEEGRSAFNGANTTGSHLRHDHRRVRGRGSATASPLLFRLAALANRCRSGWRSSAVAPPPPSARQHLISRNFRRPENAGNFTRLGAVHALGASIVSGFVAIALKVVVPAAALHPQKHTMRSTIMLATASAGIACLVVRGRSSLARSVDHVRVLVVTEFGW